MRSLAFLLAAALPLGAQASLPRPHSPGRMAQALGLSPEQQARMQAIREKHLDALKGGREASHAQFQSFRTAVEDPKVTEPQLRQAFDQMNAIRFQSLLDRRAMRLEMRAVLTPEQQAKADAMKAAFKARIKARMAERRAAWMNRQSLESN